MVQDSKHKGTHNSMFNSSNAHSGYNNAKLQNRDEIGFMLI